MSGSSERNVAGIVAASLLGLAAVGVLLIASSSPRHQEPPATVLALPATTSTTTTSTTTQTTPPPTLDSLGFGDVIPGVSGDLVVAITAAEELDLIRWPEDGPETTTSIPMITGPVLEFDSSGHRLAFAGHPVTEAGGTLHVGNLDGWTPTAAHVTSFTWHAKTPRLLAWVEADRGLCQASFRRSTHENVTCIPGVEGRLVGFDDSGFLVIDGDEVVRLGADGTEVAGIAGYEAHVGPDGRVLVVKGGWEERVLEFWLAGPDLSDARRLEWAPESALGEYGFVAWSPVANPAELAFLVAEEGGSFSVEHRTAAGDLVATFDLPGRMWDIDWDSTGRYLLVPGVTPANSMVLHLIEVTTGTVFHIPFDNWVQDATLLTTSDCRPAGQLSPYWTGRVAQGVLLRDFWHVRSRNPDLAEWRFLSARVVGGDHDGEIATWALPGFAEGGPQRQALPANAAASEPDRAPSLPDISGYDIADWMDLDGAVISQWCVEAFG